MKLDLVNMSEICEKYVYERSDGLYLHQCILRIDWVIDTEIGFAAFENNGLTLNHLDKI